jgi:hypothetical protein
LEFFLTIPTNTVYWPIAAKGAEENAVESLSRFFSVSHGQEKSVTFYYYNYSSV